MMHGEAPPALLGSWDHWGWPAASPPGWDGTAGEQGLLVPWSPASPFLAPSAPGLRLFNDLNCQFIYSSHFPHRCPPPAWE